MTNREIQQALQAIQPLLTMKLPIRTAMKLRTAARSLAHISQDIEAERKKLVHEFAKRDEKGEFVIVENNGNTWHDFGDNLAKFNAAYSDLMDCQAVGQPAPICIHELGEIEIEASILIGLGELINESA